MQIKKRLNKKGALALSQIFILIIGIIAISYAVGSSLEEVRGNKNTYWVLDVDDFRTGYLDSNGEFIKTGDQLPLSSSSTPVDVTSSAGGENQLPEKPGGENQLPEKPGGENQLPEKPGIVDRIYGIQDSGSFVDVIGSSFAWAITVYGIVKMVTGLFGMDDEKADALSQAAAAGTLVGRGVYGFMGEGATGWLGMDAVAWGWTSGIIVAAVVFVVLYKKETTKKVDFECPVWDAPVGGNDCEKCNDQGILPCSEYQCRSLGQACQLINAEEGGINKKCVWVNRNDVEFPIIKPWEDALLNGYRYAPDDAISPPDRGVKIINENSGDGCAEAFTPLTFGITTDEPASCKIDYARKENFEAMSYPFGGSSLFKYEHNQTLSLPGADNLASENLSIENDGEFEMYVRCSDVNGNVNTANFVFKYCVQKGPDTTPPLIVTTSLLNNMPVAYDQSSVDLEVYVNEPATCKWSHLDQTYEEMEEIMSCSTSILEMNAQMLYKCSTTLTDLKNRQDNNFYFRCKDKPFAEENDRNANKESYKFNLIGTEPLVIDSVGPSETIKDSTLTVKVELTAKTSFGYDEGKSTCYYSQTGEDNDYIMFLYENSDNINHEHLQELWLPEGIHEYYIKCIDLGGNSDVEKTSFIVESDSTSPIIVRAYHEDKYLKLITNEDAECVYDIIDCSYLFADGIKMSDIDKTDHYTEWSTENNFYIKCIDNYGNQPTPSNTCSMVVRPFEI
jgi:hypothetical protein